MTAGAVRSTARTTASEYASNSGPSPACCESVTDGRVSVVRCEVCVAIVDPPHTNGRTKLVGLATAERGSGLTSITVHRNTKLKRKQTLAPELSCTAGPLSSLLSLPPSP